MSKQIATAWQFGISASLIMDQLSSRLYRDAGRSLMELVRNGAVACMPNETWNPSLGQVEVHLVKNHPLAPGGTSLVVLDRGHGFTDGDVERFCMIGASLKDRQTRPKGTHAGGAQQRIGRFAALSLNEKCLNGDPTTGFFLLTRTTAKGPVTMVTLTPAEIEAAGRALVKTLDPTSIELGRVGAAGSLNGFVGSFSAIVIPSSVFKTDEEIRRAIEWHIPRKQSQMFSLMVGGKLLQPPPLASALVDSNASVKVEVYLERAEKGSEDEDGGIWLCDLETGFRVAFCPELRLPYPFQRYEIRGDIFVSNLLAHQDTARGTLASSYLKQGAWRRVILYLSAHLANKAKALLGDDDSFGDSGVAKTVRDVISLFGAVYGQPETNVGVVELERESKIKSPDGGGGGTEREKKSSGEKKKPKARMFSIRIDGEDFALFNRDQGPYVFAEVDFSRPEVIYLNTRGYQVMPRSREARAEHVLLGLLHAVARNKFPNDSDQAQAWTIEQRAKFLAAN